VSRRPSVHQINPLDLSRGFPPSIAFRGQDSTGEEIQRAFPDAKVVKALGTVNCQIMVDPSRVKGDHDVFVNGNDADAKARVPEILRDWSAGEVSSTLETSLDHAASRATL
jgi:predicted dinucleotide-binding enzyme